MLSTEQRLLGSLRTDPTAGNELVTSLLDGSDTQALLELAQREGLGQLLHAHLSNAGLLAALPSDQGADLADLRRRTTALNMRSRQRLADLLQRLGPTGVGAVVLKGAALLESLYDDPGLRPTGDIDLWVAEEQLATLVEVLRSCGYEAEPFYPDIYRLNTTTIDLHTHLLGAERVRSRESILAAGQGPMLEDLVPVAFGEAVGMKLGPPQELLLLTLHLLKHNADRLLWLVEINELARRCGDDDWDRFLELARRMGQRRAICQVAFLADLLLPDVSTSRLRRLASDDRLGRRDRRLLSRRATKGELPLWAPLVLFSSRGSLWMRVRSIVETLFPRPEIMRQIYRDTQTSVWKLYVRRLGHLIGWAIGV